MRADSRRRSVERVKAYRSGRFIQCTNDRSAGETSISFRGRLSHRYAHSYLAVPRSASIHSEFHRGSRVAFAPPTTTADHLPATLQEARSRANRCVHFRWISGLSRRQRHYSLRARKPCYTPPCGDEL